MNCTVCNRNNAVTLSICPSCGTRINDSGREKLKYKTRPIKSPNSENTGKLWISVTSKVIVNHEELMERTIENARVKLENPPASLFLKFSNLLPKRYSLDLEQNISDMRLEYYDALSKKTIWKAKCIVLFYYIGFVWSGILWISDKVKRIVGIVPKKN